MERLGGDNGAAGGDDGFGGGRSDRKGNFEGFFQFAGADNLEALLLHPLEMKFQDGNGGFLIDGIISLEFIEGVKSNNNRLAFEGFEAAFTADERRTANKRELTAFKPEWHSAAGLLAFLAATNSVTTFSGTITTAEALGRTSFDFS